MAIQDQVGTVGVGVIIPLGEGLDIVVGQVHHPFKPLFEGEKIDRKLLQIPSVHILHHQHGGRRMINFGDADRFKLLADPAVFLHVPRFGTHVQLIHRTAVVIVDQPRQIDGGRPFGREKLVQAPDKLPDHRDIRLKQLPHLGADHFDCTHAPVLQAGPVYLGQRGGPDRFPVDPLKGGQALGQLLI